MNQQKQFLKKLKQSGIPADGLVTGHMLKHPYPAEHRTECTEIFGEQQAELTVQITYKTRENTAVTMELHMDDLSAYPVGTPVKLRYLHENGHYIALPKSMLFAEHPASSETHRIESPFIHTVLKVLLVLGVFVVAAGLTAAVIWVCLNR